MPNPRYAESNLRHDGDQKEEGHSFQGKKSPNKVGKIGARAHKIYQQPNRFGIDKKKRTINKLKHDENPGTSHYVVPVRYG